MNVTMTEIKKLREMTGAGLADCKKALAEAEDMDGAVAILRKKGQAVAAKRSDREAAEGCVLVKAENGFGAIIALKCETDFVAKNADFVALAQSILDAAVAAKCKTLDEVKALPMGAGTVQDAVTERSGVTGEKMELDGYSFIESENIATYNHMNRNGLCTMVAFNKAVELQKEHNYTFVHPFDNENVIAGQGTIGLEILDQMPDIDAVIVPIGGGGLISGVAFAIKNLNPNIKVYGVQASGAPSIP